MNSIYHIAEVEHQQNTNQYRWICNCSRIGDWVECVDAWTAAHNHVDVYNKIKKEKISK